MRKTMTLFVMMLLALYLAGCTKPNDNGDTNSNVKVTTYTPTDITSTSASCGGDAIVDGNVSLTELGVCWGTSPNPTPNDNKQSTGICDKPYVCTIYNLSPNTTYHVRAFAYDGSKYYYGEDKSFTTETSGGGGSYGTLISGKWAWYSPTYEDLYMNIIFDHYDVEGKIFFYYGNNFSCVMAFGDYSISGNIVTATYERVSFDDVDLSPWVYGHTYGFVNGQSKTVTYTIQSCTSNHLVLKESVYGDILEMDRY